MSVEYVLTKAAAADLREIIRFTRKRWGDSQALSYVSSLRNGIEQLVAGISVAKDVSELYPNLRALHCQSHYIFYLPRDQAPALVIAILHERMDWIARVAKRLV